MSESDRPTGFVPGRYQIDAYGRGGFRFADMSHRGSILALPSGMRAWPVTRIGDLGLDDIAPLLAEAAEIDILIVGTGTEILRLPRAVTAALNEAGIAVDEMQTGSAARTYNILVAERRRAAAALVAVD